MDGRTLNARGRADYADFIIPGVLFMAEYQAAGTETEKETPALTAS